MNTQNDFYIQKKLVEDWNSQYPIGTKVKVRFDNDTIQECRTRSLAYLVRGHGAVVFLEELVGSHLLSTIEPILEK